ncbi:DNA-binding protein [uncultured Bacteroides sp.]|uniref:DNA-binding protein n=1 Tax=uncultured Bacteroides sp. TaxID=162156 RepID=UPI002AA5F95A|nr:DNA-binding protein [uncultured Bacteroides sp.]
MKRHQGKVEPVPKRWLSKDEAMAYLGCSDKYLTKLRLEFSISFSQVGKMIWYDLQSIDRFILKNKVV